MQRLFTKWWRGGRWLDPPMLLVGFFFAGIWFLWPVGEPGVASGVAPEAHTQIVALPVSGWTLSPSRRPDDYVRRSGDEVADDGLSETLLGWLDVPAGTTPDVGGGGGGLWWFPPQEATREGVLAGDAFESLAERAALAHFHESTGMSRAERVVSTSVVVVVSQELAALGFELSDLALGQCVKSDVSWQVQVSVHVVDRCIEDILVVSGHEDSAVNHGVVRAVSLGTVRLEGECEGAVTLSWAGCMNPTAIAQP